MRADDLLRHLSDRGVQLFLDGDRLRFRAPVGALTTSLRGDIATHRAEIIERLMSGVAAPSVSRRCTYCDWRNWVDEAPKDGRIRTTCGVCGKWIGYRPEGTRPE